MEAVTVAAAAACAGGAAAWYAAINGSRTLRRARLDSRERTRPLIVAALRAAPYVDGIQVLVISNRGPTLARNVHVRFDPAIPDPDDPHQSTAPYLTRRYAEPIAVIAPGTALENVWFVGRPEGGTWVNDEPMPDRAIVCLTYESSDGTRYQDEIPIDVAWIKMGTSVSSTREPEALAKAAVKALEGIRAALQ